MVAVDLDGEGRPGVVVSDTHATLHVWRHAGNGRLRPVRPHRGPVQREAGDGTTPAWDPRGRIP